MFINDHRFFRRSISSITFVGFLLVALLLQTLPLAAGNSQDVSLDLSGSTIVLPNDPHPAERYAAEELRRLIKQSTGRTLSITSETRSQHSHLFVGPSSAMRNRPVGFDTEKMENETVRIRARNGDVAIAGGSSRGTLYAVYSFLEREFGVRFLTPNHTHVPDRSSPIKVERNYTHTPPFQYRHSYYHPVKKDHAFAARLRINAIPRKTKFGGQTNYRNVNHTFSQFVSWNEYGEEHPEYFALHDGNRPKGVDRHQTYEFQLCPTEPAVRKIIIRKVLKRLEQHPDQKVVSVSQSDNGRYCQCSDCRAVNERENSPMGAQLELVNAVAKAVEKKHPDVLVGTLAYQYTRKPPEQMKPRDNVLIQLCSIEACQVHAMDHPDCPLNASFRRDMETWSKKANHLSIWNYNVNFSDYLAPCPNIYNIGANVKTFVKHGVISAFMQGDAAAGGEFAHLRNYLICRLLWNPDLNPDRVIDEFFRLHYGKAAPQVRTFLDTIHRMARDGEHHGDCFATLDEYGLDAQELSASSGRLLKKARKRAESDAVRNRLERLSLIRSRLRIQPLIDHLRKILREKEFTPLPEKTATRMEPRFNTFIETCQKLGVEQLTEGTGVEEFEAIGRALLRSGDVPEILRQWLNQ